VSDDGTQNGTQDPAADPADGTGGAPEPPVTDPTPDPAPVSDPPGEGETGGDAPATDQPSVTITPPAEEDPAVVAKRGWINNLVEEWWNDHFPGSVLGRSTEMWNHVHGAKEALKTKLDAWTTTAAPAAPAAPSPPPPSD